MSLFRRFIRPGVCQADAPSPDRLTGISVTAAGYIDLGTASGYLTGLKAKAMAISMWFKAGINQTNWSRIWSATTANGVGAWFAIQDNVDHDKPKINWSRIGANAVGLAMTGAPLGSLYNITVILDGVTTGRAFQDGVADGTDEYAGLADADSTKITLGARAYDYTSGIAGKYGPFAVLDLSSSGIGDAATSLALAAAIYNAGTNAEAMRATIMAQDGLIVGKYWKLNELAPGQASAASDTINRYAVETGALEGAANSATSGATGVAW